MHIRVFNLHKMLCHFSIIFLFLFLNCNGDNKNNLIATYSNGNIKKGDIESPIKNELIELKKKESSLYMNAARKILKDKILTLDSKIQNISKEKLIEDYIKKNNSKIDEKVLKEYYDKNKNRFNLPYSKMKKAIESLFKEEFKNQSEKNYMEQLFKKYEVKFVEQ